MKSISPIIVPIIKNEKIENKNLFEIFKNKKVIIFGVPGAFTPTCSDQHLPGFIEMSNRIKSKNIDEIYCMSVNDKYVMKAWFSNYAVNESFFGIADGNAEVSKMLDVAEKKRKNYMGIRCMRFSMIINNNIILKIFFDSPGIFENTSAENLFKNL